MRQALKIVLLVCCLYKPAFSQQPLQYSFGHYNLNNGLAAYYVTSMVQDDQGYMWIGTLNGLQRFDGNRFITFFNDPANPASIPNNFISWIHFDKKNRLWLAFADGKAGIFDTRKFVFKEAAIKLKNNKYFKSGRSFFEDSRGNIICSYMQNEIVVYDEARNEFSAAANPYPTPPGWRIVNMKEDVAGKKMYMGTDSGLVVYNLQTKVLNYAGHNPDKEKLIEQWGRIPAIAILLVDQQHRVWFESWPIVVGGPTFYCFDLRNGKPWMAPFNLFHLVDAYYEIAGMMQQKDGSIWIHGLGVFARFNEELKKFIPIDNTANEKRISFTSIHSLFEDREHNMWVASNDNGIFIFNPSLQLFNSIKHQNRVTKKTGRGSIMSFMQLKSGDILTGVWGDGIYRYNKNFENVPLNIHGLPENNGYSAWSMCRLNDNNTIWMGLQPGILVYDEKANRARYYNPPVFENQTLRRIQQDGRNNIWIGTQRRGVYKWDPQKGKTKMEDGFSKFTAIPDCQVMDIRTDNKGFVWIGTINYGVYKIDPAKNTIVNHYTSNTGPGAERMLSNDVSSLLQYDDTTVLIAAGGLNILDTKTNKIVHVHHYNQLALEQVVCMQKDNLGNVWLSMVNGLCVMKPGKKSFTFFDRNDGMMNDNFIDNASMELPDGRLLFGSANDFIVFHPEIARVSSKPPEVVITDFKVQNKSLLIDSLNKLNRIELSSIQNSIVIEFATLSYLNKFPIIYQMENIDKEWKKANELRQAIYNYLPPGNYTFRVKAEYDDRKLNQQITELHIRIKPPFWKTWWFVAIIALAAIYIFFWLDKLRMQKLRATESIRSRIATSLTEDMTSSLSSINIASELARIKVDKDKERTKEYIAQISDTSNRMVQAMYDMVWSIHPNNDTMKDTLERMKTYAMEMEELHNIDIIFDVDEASAKIDLDMENRYELLSIFKEAILNAVKHSAARYIQVGIRIRGSKFYMLIEDDGKGFDIDVAAMGRGISDMRRRAEAIKAQFYIESDINTGTMIKVEMPV